MRRFGLLGVLTWLAACATEPREHQASQGLTAAQKRERATLIRDTAAQMGLHNAALLGGVAISETGFAHCWSEATWACQGPDSPSCGGPIIAGASDGPCADEQGGLGMFQFDAGTYAQTVAAYGDSVLTVEGNTAQAVNFVVNKAELDIDGVHDWLSAVAWMDTVPMTAGDPVMEQWAHLMACRYNGCCSTNATCTTRANGYRDNAISIFNELGADFWATAGACATLPDGGVIEQRTSCYLAGGDPRYWRAEATAGMSGDEWTKSTADSADANFAEWFVKGAGTGHVEAYVDGSELPMVTYEVAHAGAVERVTVDVSAGGWVPLGDFAFAGTGDEHVRLGDAQGTAGKKLVFDAIRVSGLDGTNTGSGSGGDDDGMGGGCAAADGASVASLAIVGVMLAMRRRRK